MFMLNYTNIKYCRNVWSWHECPIWFCSLQTILYRGFSLPLRTV